MLLIPCPYCGARSQEEFVCRGEAVPARPADPARLSDAEWADYLFLRDNRRGLVVERWLHRHGCRRWFVLLRDTVSDRILAAAKPGETPAAP
ncbi:MAG TPA: sarcosine oxidase subunit delta [Stellaceae bacterium]|nr:sarcosine oxidase subunit delta [Stellaceae bacterium]